MTRELAALTAIAREMETLPGHLGFYYKNLATGFEYGVREDEAYLAASVIKFPLLLHVLEKSRFRGNIPGSEADCGGLGEDAQLRRPEPVHRSRGG